MRVLTLILDFSLSLLRVSHQFGYSCKQSWTWARDVGPELGRVAIGRTLRNDADCGFEGLVLQVATYPC
jgi:hypothetical protein